MSGNETSGAYAVAIEMRHRPSVLAFSRQACANLEGTSIEGVYKGAYVVKDAEGGKPQLTIVGSGSELSLAYKAAEILSDLKVDIFSLFVYHFLFFTFYFGYRKISKNPRKLLY